MSVKPGRSSTLRVIAVCVPVLAFLVLVIDERMRHGANPRNDIAAELSLGPHGYLQFVYAAMIAMFAYALYRSAKLRSGPFALWLVALACVAAACFADSVPPPGRWPRTYNIHFLCSAAAALLIPGALAICARELWAHKTWKSLGPWTALAACVATAAFVRALAFPSPHLVRYAPLSAFLLSRAELVILLSWALAVAVVLWLPQGEKANQDPEKWERISKKIEVFSVPLVLVGGIIALLEYCEGHKRDRHETASKAYETADEKWTEFLKLCLDHPETDCYSGASLGSAATPTDEAGTKKSVEQRLVFEYLIDTFEVAYVNYNNADYAADAPREYCTQWTTWMVALRKYAKRPAFRRAWAETGDEYDTNYQACVDATIFEQTGLTREQWNGLAQSGFPKRKPDDPELPAKCELYDCRGD